MAVSAYLYKAEGTWGREAIVKIVVVGQSTVLAVAVRCAGLDVSLDKHTHVALSILSSLFRGRAG